MSIQTCQLCWEEKDVRTHEEAKAWRLKEYPEGLPFSPRDHKYFELWNNPDYEYLLNGGSYHNCIDCFRILKPDKWRYRVPTVGILASQERRDIKSKQLEDARRREHLREASDGELLAEIGRRNLV